MEMVVLTQDNSKMMLLKEEVNFNILTKINILGNLLMDKSMVMVNTFFHKELFLMDNGLMMKRLKAKCYFLMEMNFKEYLKITTDLKDYTNIKMEMFMKVSGSMT
jgi:hypothetical protein